MSAERFEISEGELDVLAITGPEGTRYIDGEEIEARAIRQQARDIAELRTDLAAAVAENAALLAANRDCILHFDAIKTDYDAMKLRAEQAEARLAAIESAPTVAMLCPLTESAFNESTLMTAYQKAKMPHVELIARPAKD